MNLFNQDNVIHNGLNMIGNIVIANLLFLLCSIPIVTIGPSLTALYHCMLRTVKGNSIGIVKTFFQTFKQNFRQSLLVWIGICAVGTILFLNLDFLREASSVYSKIFFYLSGIVIAFLVIITLYIFPVIAAFSNTTRNLLKNAFLFSFMHFPSTLAIAVISILPMYMTYRDLTLMPLYACCWFFFGFGLSAYVNSLLLYRIFKPFLEQN